jgi:predicted MFS family arabinose efflux permease
MTQDVRADEGETIRLALAGHLAMASALGIGRFVYTPILPPMIAALGWSKSDAGLVVSANFLGYLIGAFAAGSRVFASDPRRWMMAGLAVSAATTAATGLLSGLGAIAVVRFTGGLASAFVLICASTLVLDQVARTGNGRLMALHFAGAGAGIVASAAAVSLLTASGAGWSALWLAAGAMAALLSAGSAALMQRSPVDAALPARTAHHPAGRGAAALVASYALFGFSYVITATFLVTMVRETAGLSPIEPWVWILFGLAVIPSVPFWQWVAGRTGLLRAYSVACLVEAVGVIACVSWVGLASVCVTAVLLGGTFVGITALGLMGARALAAGQAQRMIGLMTAGFGIGQMTGPLVAGVLADRTGGFLAPSLLAGLALVAAALLAELSRHQSRPAA